MTLTDTQLRVLENIISGVLGASTSLGIQWMSTRKQPKDKGDQQNEYLTTVTKTSGENINAAQQVIDMLQEMLKDQTEAFNRKIEDAKDNCSVEIGKLKAEYDIKIGALQADNEALHIKSEKLTNENLLMSIQLASLKTDRDKSVEKLNDFKKRLSQYENVTTDKMKAVKSNDDETGSGE